MAQLVQKPVRIFLTGDVMLGRGIDQILAQPCNPVLYESYVKDARSYVKIAEEANGKFPKRSVTSDATYIWGDLLNAFETYSPDVKLINLETSITTCDNYWPHKGINYRMNPNNSYVFKPLSTANTVMTLANNHVIDWGFKGLTDSLQTLRDASIQYCGAGNSVKEAWSPAVIPISKEARVLIFGVGTESSGVPYQWEITEDKKTGGMAMVDPYNINDAQLIIDAIKSVPTVDNCTDVRVVSIHWGGNWGWDIPKQFIAFAHRLIDSGMVDIIHGHSSHHIKGFELYKKKVIFYGCGDFLSDYEGIRGHKEFRDDLSFMYFVDFDINQSEITNVILKGSRVKHFRVNYAEGKDLEWLHNNIKREAKRLGADLHLWESDGTLQLLEPSSPQPTE